MWGPGLLQGEALAQQAAEQKAAVQNFGAGFDLPPDEEAAAAAETAVTGEGAPPPKEMGLSVATVEQRLTEDPAWWPEALAMELERQLPRKSALRAILRTAEEEKGDEGVIAQARAVLGAL